jgi:hypothetical protein
MSAIRSNTVTFLRESARLTEGIERRNFSKVADQMETLEVALFAAELRILAGMTDGQKARQRVRWSVERGEFSDEQLEILCSCAKPNCVVHAREYKP